MCLLRSHFSACKVGVINWTGFVLRVVIWGHNRNCVSASSRIRIMTHAFGRTEGKWAWSSWRAIIALEFDCSNWDTWTLPGEYESQGAEQNWMCAHRKLSVTPQWPICAGHAVYYHLLTIFLIPPTNAALNPGRVGELTRRWIIAAIILTVRMICR